MRPFFSIIIPTYNRGHVLGKTIQSVINQNFNDWELIVVDDGSTDNTKNIINDFSKNDSRIRYIYQDNQERSAARNNGIENSNGKYICFLDSDDEYLQHHLSTFYDEIKIKKKPKGLFFSSLIIYNNGTDINHPIKELNTNDTIYNYLFREGIYPCRVCIERSILNEFKFRLDSIIVEDTILWLEIASKYPIFQISKKTVNYFQHEENSVNKKFNPCQKMLRGFKNFEKNNPFVYNKISKKLRTILISDLYYGMAVSHIINSKRFIALYYLIISIIIDKESKRKHKILLILKLITLQKMEKILFLVG